MKKLLMEMRACTKWGVAVLAVLAVRCAPALSSQGAGVSVFLVKMDDPKRPDAMPEGCHLLATRPAVSMTEADIAVQKDPYRLGRNDAGAAGANALLVRSRVTVPRRTANCPVASPITDCPGNSGAWYSLVYESYACTPDALKQLNTPSSPRPSPPNEDE
jgi:hypothetical protein